MQRSFTFLTILVMTCACHAQLTIQNKGDLGVPSDRAQVIFSTACRVVREEFHLPGAELHQFRLTLVVGSLEDRYEDDHDAGIYRIYLKKWDEKKFAVGVLRLAVEGMISRHERDRLVWQILTRSNAIGPVPAR